MGLLRNAGLALHRCFTWNPPLARAYARTWQRGLASIREGALKDHLRNNLLGARWPDGAFGVQRVALTARVAGRFEPVPGSLPFRKALFRERLAHEPEVFDFLESRLPSYDAVLEIGANVGVYTVFFAKSLPRGQGPRVFSFEPSPRAFAQLLRHVELNGLGNVRAFNQAVGPPGPMAPFYENARDWMKGSVDVEMAAQFEGSAGRIEVPVAGGDEVARLVRDFGKILVKIDVVGAEPMVLNALEPLLREARPDIVLGVSSLNCGPLDALATLRERYGLCRIGRSGLERRASFSDAEYCNYLLTAR